MYNKLILTALVATLFATSCNETKSTETTAKAQTSNTEKNEAVQTITQAPASITKSANGYSTGAVDDLPQDKTLRNDGAVYFVSNAAPLLSQKTNAKRNYAITRTKKQLTQLLVNENWYNTFNKATYQLDGNDSNKVTQITLETTKPFAEAKKTLAAKYGKPAAEGVNPPGQPSTDYALWIFNNTQYNMQNMGKTTQLYLMPDKH